jgi:large subunit ribosomal protein L10
MAAVRGTPPKWKVQTVEGLTKLISSHPVVAIVGFRGVPANQMQKIRRDFKGKAELRVVKNSLLERALDAAGNSYRKLKDYIEDQVAIIATEMNPFKLFKMIEETKIPSPLKPNQISPVDVVVEKGPTSFPPGPVIGEFQMAGIPAAIERGKIVIKETVTVVRANEIVKPEVARALEKLEIKPIKIGLDVKAIYDSGVILTPDVLAIDTEKVAGDIQRAYTMALNLAVNSAYVTAETAEILILKAYMDARNLAINAGIFEKNVIQDIISKAHSEMLSLASILPPDALDEELKEIVSGAISAAQVTTVEKPEKEVEEVKEEEKEEEEEEKEEEAIEGLGALFG